MSHDSKITQDHENRIRRLELTNEAISKTLVEIKDNLRTLDQDMKQGFKDINNRMWTNFFWMLAGFIGVLSSHSMKWI